MKFMSIVDSSTVIDSVWKGKINSARYKGLQVTYTKDTSHPSSHANTIQPIDPGLYTPIHELFRPVVVGQIKMDSLLSESGDSDTASC